MTLATLPLSRLAAVPCFYTVALDAVPTAITLRLYAIPQEHPDARAELMRWRHDCTGHLADLVRAHLMGRTKWGTLADWLEAYGDTELTGIPGDLRATVGATWRLQRERFEADTQARLSRRA